MTDSLLALPGEFWDSGTPPHFDNDRQSWQVFNYADVVRVLTDTSAFSQVYGDPESHPVYAVMWNADDPRHRDLRAIVSEPFHQSVLSKLAPTIDGIATALVDEILAADANTFEAVSTLGQLPNRVICTIMGVELSDETRFASWLDQTNSASTLDTIPAMPDMIGYFTELLDRRRRTPQIGLVDELISAQRNGYRVAGEPLSDRDIVGYLWGLLAAGSDTTATALVNVLLFLCAYGWVDEVRDDPTLLAGAIEESLRWYPPFPANTVVSRTAVEFGDRHVPAGQLVTAWISSANRDPAIFSSADRFDPRRRPNPHLTFGRGGNYCLGAPLARLELQIALTIALDRLSDLRWESSLPIDRTLGIVNRVKQAQFSFRPGAT